MSERKSTQLKRKASEDMDEKSVHSLYEALKVNHLTLKTEVKIMCSRFVNAGEGNVLKGHILSYPPLHGMVDILDHAFCSPMKSPVTRPSLSPVSDETPKTSKRVFGTKIKCATKELKYSPRVSPASRRAGGSGSSAASPNSILAKLVKVEEAADTDDEDDVVEVEAI